MTDPATRGFDPETIIECENAGVKFWWLCHVDPDRSRKESGARDRPEPVFADSAKNGWKREVPHT
jgi:hypothetical protein